MQTKRAIKTTAFVVGILYICWLPYLVCMYSISSIFPKIQQIRYILFVTVHMLILNSSMNFFIYLICNNPEA